MNRKVIIISAVLVAFILGATISYLFTPTTDDIPYTVIDDSSIESHITKSYLDNGNLIIDIYNPNCEIVKVKPATIEHHVTAGMDSVKIFNYTDQYFEVIVGNASDVYTFGSLTKTWDAKNKTVAIKSNGVPSMSVKLISSEPDLCTFTEVFEVTNFNEFTPHKDKDFKARTVKHKGKKDVTNVEWFIEQNISYVVNVTDYKVIQVDSEIYNNITERNETIQINKTIVAGYHDKTRYKNVWQEYNHHGKPVSKDTVQRIKVVYHKKPELGDVRIQTIPLFRGVECDELTWWNTSWGKRRSIVIDHTKVDAVMTNFPVMVSITQLGLNIDGNDTRIISSLGNQVAREIECYNATSGELVFFFNGTSISSTVDTSFWMYYNNSAASEPAVDSTYGSEAVWNSNYDAVYLMNIEPNGAGAGGILDSTSNDKHGTPYGFSTNKLVDDDYGKAIDFDLNTYYIKAPTGITSFPVTLTLYSKISQHDTIQQTLLFLDEWGDTQYRYGITTNVATPTKYGAQANSGSSSDAKVSIETVDYTNYNVLDFVISSNTDKKLYLNGIEILSLTTSVIFNSNVDVLLISNMRNLDGSGADQNVGFVSITNTAKSVNESITTYNNLNNPTATGTDPFFASFGAEEDVLSITSYAPSTPLNKLESESQLFNVTTDVNCQCRWYINGSLKQTNTTQQTDHNYTNTSLEIGYYNFSAVVNTSGGVTVMQTWWVTVTNPGYIPPPPELSNTTGGDFWANFTWTPGSGNVTDSYNVCYNGTWDNGTTTPYRNESISGGGWHNITVCAWNSSGIGTQSETCVEDNIEAPSYKPPNPTTLTNTTGNFWIRHAWNAGAGNITDEYAVNVNGSWYNTTDSFINLNKPPHGYQNITVQAWNSSGVGTLSAGTLSDNVSLPNNPVTLTNYSLVYSIQEFDTITIDFDYTDADGDTVTFATNAVNGTLNGATGVYSWTTTWMDRSVNHWTFNVSDGYGSVDSVVVEIEVATPACTNVMETFQYHPDDDLMLIWATESDSHGSNSWHGSSTTQSYTSTVASGTGSIVQRGETYNKELKIYTNSESYQHPAPDWVTTYAYYEVVNTKPMSTEYFSFTAETHDYHRLDGSNCGTTGNVFFKVLFYDVNGVFIKEKSIVTRSWGIYDDGTANYYTSKTLYEFKLEDNPFYGGEKVLYMYENGTRTYIGNFGADKIGYVMFQNYADTYSGFCGIHRNYIETWIDDISTSTAIGLGADRTPYYEYTHYMTRTAGDPDNQPAYEIDASYTLDSTDSTYNDSKYELTVTRLTTNTLVNTTTIKESGIFPDDINPPFGTVIYNRTDLFSDKYGLYYFKILKDDVQQSYDFIFWENLNFSGGSYLYMDDVLSLNSEVDIGYVIGNPDLSTYNYYIKIYDIDFNIKDSFTLTEVTSNVTLDTTGYCSGYHFVILLAELDDQLYDLTYKIVEIVDYANIQGTSYFAPNGSVLSDVYVTAMQVGTWHNTTSDAYGMYELNNFRELYEINISASKLNYVHESFAFTPPISYLYTIDLYLFPTDRVLNGTSIVEGMTVDYPLHQALGNATVNLYNATWSNTTTSNAFGYYQFNLSELVNGTYTVNATLSGYDSSSEYSISVVEEESTVQNIVLSTDYLLTVTAKDTNTMAMLSTFTAMVDGESITTTNGSVVFSLSYGLYSASTSADNYYPGVSSNVLMNENKSVEVFMIPVVTDYYDPSHYVSFIVQSITGTLYAGVTTSVYNAADSSGTAIYSDVTGSDGVVGFELNETTLYRITFVDAAQGINEEFTLYPIDTEYVVIVSSSISFDPGTPDTNLTNTTIQYTNQSWSIQNLTGDYLSTTLGISHTGQGVIAATICWATASVACGAPTLVVLGILAHLGIISWVMVLFTGMTMLSIYILGGKIG